jgi:hypothetical protein
VLSLDVRVTGLKDANLRTKHRVSSSRSSVLLPDHSVSRTLEEGLPRWPAVLPDEPSMSPTTKDRSPTMLGVSLDDDEGLPDRHAVVRTDEAVLPMEPAVDST